jgi:hypothetical protein
MGDAETPWSTTLASTVAPMAPSAVAAASGGSASDA